jgi:hypothetical protein
VTEVEVFLCHLVVVVQPVEVRALCLVYYASSPMADSSHSKRFRRVEEGHGDGKLTRHIVLALYLDTFVSFVGGFH